MKPLCGEMLLLFVGVVVIVVVDVAVVGVVVGVLSSLSSLDSSRTIRAGPQLSLKSPIGGRGESVEVLTFLIIFLSLCPAHSILWVFSCFLFSCFSLFFFSSFLFFFICCFSPLGLPPARSLGATLTPLCRHSGCKGCFAKGSRQLLTIDSVWLSSHSQSCVLRLSQGLHLNDIFFPACFFMPTVLRFVLFYLVFFLKVGPPTRGGGGSRSWV